MPNGLRETSSGATLVQIRSDIGNGADDHDPVEHADIGGPARQEAGRVRQLVLKDRQRFWVGVGAHGDGRHVIVVGHVRSSDSAGLRGCTIDSPDTAF